MTHQAESHVGLAVAYGSSATSDMCRWLHNENQDASTAHAPHIDSNLPIVHPTHPVQVEDWAVELFAEEVVRGGPAFAVSLILSAMEPGFRAAAELGAWQLISPVNATGRVVVVSNLHEVQDKVSTLPVSYLDLTFLLCQDGLLKLRFQVIKTISFGG